MKRAAIYARYSTDLQNERSTEDQIELCRAYAQREGLAVVGTYEDKAKSGASVLGREALYAMMQDAQEKKFEVIIVEALDRLSRDMEDLAGMYKRLTFHGVEIKAVHEGTVNTILVGLRGIVGQLYREDNVHKVRRGMSGLIRQGLYAGGRAYGYRSDPVNKGKLLVVEEEAAIVRRIFEEFVSGKSPRRIAHDLNKEGIPPPRGSKWNASTINGNLSRGYGILLNSIYVGKLVWNRVQMVKDPDTGKRISRPNSPDKWQWHDVPELQIVPTEIWEAAQAQKVAFNQVPPKLQKRPKRLLSGLLRCGSCGSGMTTTGKDKSGRYRLRCSAQRESNSCPDPKTFYLETVENLVLDTLARELRDPKRLMTFLSEYIEERKRLAREIIKNRSWYEKELARVERELERNANAYVKGFLDDAYMERVTPQLRAERAKLQAALAQQPEVPDTVTLHPQALKSFEQQLTNLRDALQQGIDDGQSEAAHYLRQLIRTVTVYRDDSKPGGVKVKICGELNPLIGLEAYSDERMSFDGSGRPTHSKRILRYAGMPFGGSGGPSHSQGILGPVLFELAEVA